MAFLSKLGVVVAIAFFVAGMGSLFLNLEANNREDLKQTFQDDPTSSSANSFIVALGYDLTTPAWQFEWIGNEERKTWMLEDIPFPDSKDFLYLVPWWFLAMWISRMIWRSTLPTISKVLWIIALFTIGTVLIWLIVKTIAYFAMISAAESLGIKEQVLSARADVIAKTHESGGVVPLLLATAVSSFLLISSLIGGRSRD